MENPLIRMRGGVDSSVDNTPHLRSTIAQAGVDHGYMYAAIFALLGCAAAIWVSHSLQTVLLAPGLKALLYLGMSASVLAIVLLFQSLLVISRSWNITLIVIESLAIMGSFYSMFSLWVFGAAILFCVLAIRGYLIERSRLENDVKFQFFRYANRFDGLFFTGFTLFCAMLLVGMLQTAGGINEGMFSLLLRGVTPALTYSLDTPVESTTRIEDIVRAYWERSLQQRPEYASLSEFEQQELLELATRDSVERVGTLIGVEVGQNETVGQYLFRVLEGLIGRINALHLGPAVAIGLLLLAILFIRSLLIFIKIPTLIVAQVVYAALSGMGIISVATEPRLKEVVVIR